MKNLIASILLVSFGVLFLAGCSSSVSDVATESGDVAADQEAKVIIESGPAEQRLESMSLEEKAAQMLMASCHESGSAQRAAAFGVGGLCLYADAFENKTQSQVIEMTDELQGLSSLSLLIGVDEEGGSVCRVSTNPNLRSAPFKSPLELYNEGGYTLIESDTQEKAQLLLDLGINVNLAPVCDVPQSTSDYMYSRSFGLDASSTADYVSLVVSIMKDSGIGYTLKHFPGYGGSADTHKGLAYDTRSYEEFAASDFLPFEAGLAAGTDSVLVSHNIVQCMDNDLPASLSPEVHRILREELGFQGVIVSDDLYMDAISQFTGGENAAVQAALAGNDLICCADYEQSAAALVAAVNDGTLDEAQIDASVLRILNWKLSLGLDISAK